MRIRGFLGSLVLLTCLPVGLFSAYLAVERTRIERDDMERHAQYLARDVGIVLDRQLVSIFSALQVLADSRALDDGRDLSPFYADALIFLRHYGRNVVLVTADGRQLLNTRRPLGLTLPPFAADAAVRQVFAAAQPVASDVVASGITQAPMIDLLVPVIRDGRVRFALGVCLPVDGVGELLQGIHLPDGWTVAILDGQAQVIAGKPPNRLSGEALPADAVATILKQQLGEISGQTEHSSRRGLVRDFYVRSSQGPWTVVVDVPQADLDRPVRRTAVELLAVAFVVVLLAFLVARLHGARLARAIAGLAAGRSATPSGIREVDVAGRILIQTRQMRRNGDRDLRDAKERAEQANQAKSRFLAAASHDLRQPFQAMTLYREVLEAQLTDPKQRMVMAALRKAMTAGEELLSSLLQISVLDAGIERPIIRSVVIADMLEPLVEEFRAQALARGLHFSYQPSSAVVATDPILLARVVRNLLSNAMKYTSRGRILLGCRRMGDHLRVEVWDTGMGIPGDKHEEIWEEFTQLHNAERDRMRGLGLGLAVVKKTAHLLRHTVDMRSWPGRGSLFFIILPRAV